MVPQSDLITYRADAIAALWTLHAANIDEWYRAHLGHSGRVRDLRKQIGGTPAEQRKEFGRIVNDIARELEELFGVVKQNISESELQSQAHAEQVDVTLPSRERRDGRSHPISSMLQEIYSVFGHLGFDAYS